MDSYHPTMWILFSLLVAVLLILLLSSRWGLQPFYSLILAACFYGVLMGMPLIDIVDLISEGFGATIGKIGLIIIFGLVIGTILEKTGGAVQIAQKVISVFGPRRLHSAMAWIGYIVSIPVFADSGFIILSSINKALSFKGGVPIAGTTVALSMGLLASHAMVPPTPGPIAAAGLLEADLGKVILMGLFASICGMLAVIVFAKYIGKKLPLQINEDVLSAAESQGEMPGLRRSLLPVLIPILLIITRSVIDYPSFPEAIKVQLSIFKTLGHPVVALFIGMLFAFMIPKRWERKILSGDGWMGEALKTSAAILMITGAGGAFGQVLQASDIASELSSWEGISAWGLWMPFLLAAILKTAQGSTTVALITTASIVAPLLMTLGLDAEGMRAMVVIAIGAGATVVSHANDSFFWVVAQLSNLEVREAYKIQTMGSLVLGLGSMLALSVLSMTLNYF